MMGVNFGQQGLICLQVASLLACTSMESENAHKHVLVVCQIRHSLDILNMCMLTKNNAQLGISQYVLGTTEYITDLGCLTRSVV